MVDITLLGKVKIPDLVLYAAVFLVLFIIGIMGGRSIGMITHSANNLQQDNLVDPVSGSSNGQWNLLIIAVDQLASPHPSLTGIWLLITSPEIQKLTLVPMFPPADLELIPADTEWNNIFSLTSEQEPNVEFLEKLNEQVLWDEYLLIDKGGLVSIWETANQLGGFSPASEVQVPEIVLPRTRVDVDLSLEGQVEIWKTICFELANIAEPDEFAHFLNQIEPHIHTRINLGEISQNLNFEDETQLQLGCEFPTLTLNSP